MKLYTVKDLASGTHLPPFHMKTDRDAIEAFKMFSNDEKTDYYKFPKDFLLMSIGDFDERNAILNTHEPKLLVCAADVKETKENL